MMRTEKGGVAAGSGFCSKLVFYDGARVLLVVFEKGMRDCRWHVVAASELL